MISFYGNGLLLSCIIFSIITIIISAIRAYPSSSTLLLSCFQNRYNKISDNNEDDIGNKSNKHACNLLQLPTCSLYISAICAIAAFTLLVYGFATSDFSLQNVFLNSSSIKPLLFKIAGSWASHEGSMLLWFCLLNLIICIYISNRPTVNTHCAELVIFSWIQLLFSCFIYITSNPFKKLPMTPTEGLGLNPMLQDIALAIHPPILYLGYICCVVPFAIGCIILLTVQNNKINIVKLLALSKSFTSYAIFFMTIGISLGSWWAYRELGWGGYWFFDPVENVSLIPWLSAIALSHSLSVTINSEQLTRWSIALSIITFLLSILGTFLVRSGMVVSIHSFAESASRAAYLLLVFTLLAIPSILLLIIYGDSVCAYKKPSLKAKSIAIANIFWVIAIAVLLLSVIYPIYYLILHHKIVSINYEYFIEIFIPIMICIVFLAAICSTQTLSKSDIIIFLIVICITLLSASFIDYGIISAIAVVGANFLIIRMLCLFYTSSNHLKNLPSERRVSMILAHIGFGALVLSCALNDLLQKDVEFIGAPGDIVEFMEFNIKLNDIKFGKGSNYYRQTAEFWVSNKANGQINILKPENRLYLVENSLSQESDIYSYLLYDIYIVLNAIRDNIVHAKIYYRPCISFIWLSVMLIAGGLLIIATHDTKHTTKGNDFAKTD